MSNIEISCRWGNGRPPSHSVSWVTLDLAGCLRLFTVAHNEYRSREFLWYRLLEEAVPFPTADSLKGCLGYVWFQIFFLQYSSHQIFEHMHEILNTVRKNN